MRRRIQIVSLILLVVVALTGVSATGMAVQSATATQSTTITSCTTITSSGTYTLGSDLTQSDKTTCLLIDADDVTVRGNGYAISGGSIGVWSEHDNIEVRNVDFRGLSTGIEYDGVSGGTIAASDFSSLDTGVSLVSTDGVTVRDNTIADGRDGIVLSGSASEVRSNKIQNGMAGVVLKGSTTGATVTNNDLDDNTNGIFFDQTTGGTVSSNDISGSRIGILLERTDSATVTQNTVTNSDRANVKLTRSKNNQFTGNTVSGGEYGVRVYTQSTSNQFSGTVVQGSSKSGVLVSDYASQNTFKGLSVTNSGKHGVFLDSVTGNEITNTKIKANTEAGVRISGGKNNEVRKSTLERNERGVSIVFGSNDNKIVRNTLTQNAEEGIRVRDADGNDLLENTARSNKVGIRLHMANSGTISKNDVRTSRTSGVIITSSNNLDFIENVVIENSYRGIEFTSSHDSSFRGTRLSRNKQHGILVDSATGIVLEDIDSDQNSHGIEIIRADDIDVRGAELIDNSHKGLFVLASKNVSAENITTSHNTNAFESDSDSANVSVKNLTLQSGTIVSFVANNVILSSVASPPSDPSDRANIGQYVKVEMNSDDAAITLSVHYDQSDVQSVEECSLRLWRHESAWNRVGNPNDVDMVANTVTAHTDSSGVFAPLGRPGSGCTLTEARAITAPGHYTLGKNLSVSEAGNGIEIRSSGVTLDGAGHSLVGTKDGDIGVYVNGTGTLSNVVVENITVSGWDTGVKFQRTERSVVQDATVSKNRQHGIYLYMFSSDNWVRRNVANDNGRNGIYVSARSAENLIDKNVANDNGRNGIFVDLTAEKVTASNNLVNGNGFAGLYLSGVTDSFALNTTANRNGVTGAFLSSSDTELGLMTAKDNGEYGIVAVGGDSEIENVLLQNNTKWDYYGNGVSEVTDADDMTITGGAHLSFTGQNVALTSATAPSTAPTNGTVIPPYLNVTGTTADAFFDANVSYDDSDIATANESTLRLWHYNNSWSPVGPSGTVYTLDNRVRGNVTSFGLVALVGRTTMPGANSTPNLTVRSADLWPDVSKTGTEATAVVVVENTGNGTGTFDAVFVADGTERGRKQVEVAPGQTREVKVNATFEKAGSYNVKVSGEPAGTLTVKDELDGVPGFGVAGAIAALAASAAIALAVGRKRNAGR